MKYPLSLTENYIHNWGLWEAIRELLQNAIDHEGGYKVDYSPETSQLSIKTFGKTLEPKSLLLGASTKQEDPTKVGQYGEGYKMALLVLTKLKHPVEIINGDVKWEPVFEFSEMFGERVLTIQEAQTEEGNDVEFKIGHFTMTDWEEVKAKCLHLGHYSEEYDKYVVDTSYGKVLKCVGGSLFVNGLFVCNTQQDYGYDIKPEYLALDRDRKSVCSFDLQWVSGRIWAEVGVTEETAGDVFEGKTDVRYIGDHSSPEQGNEFYNLAVEKYGDNAYFTDDYKTAKKWEQDGVENVVVVSTCAKELLQKSHHYAEPPKKEILSPYRVVEQLIEKQRRLGIPADLQEVLESLLKISKNWADKRGA